MLKRPWQFNFLIGLYITVVASFPLQILYILNMELTELNRAAEFLTPLNWLVVLVLLAQVPMLMDANKNLKLTVPLAAFVILANNYVVGAFSDVFSFSQVILSSLMFLLAHSLLLMKAPLSVLTNQRKRWWRTAKRKRVSLPISIEDIQGLTVAGKTFDLSSSGAFMQLNPQSIDANVGQELKVYLGDKKRELSAKLVRVCEHEGSHPQGIGVQFTDSSLMRHYKILTC